MTDPSTPEPSADEFESLMGQDSRGHDDDDLEGLLHLAELRHLLAGRPRGPVRFRQWDVERRIGRGGMGAVYLARHHQLPRKVALKVLSRVGTTPSLSSARMAREAKALARVDHPNVLRIHSVDLSGPYPVIELEYVDGPTLRTWVEDSDPSWKEIVAAYAEAAEGLAAIHEEGLVHRDIKPDNLLRSTDGVVKVADLGLAVGSRGLAAVPESNERDADVLEQSLTMDGAVVGTHGYMAPEVVVDGTASAASDQFSFAVALYEALYGARPFVGQTPGEVADAMRVGRLTRPDDAPTYPRWLVAALARGLRFDEGQRYPSMREFVADLRRGLGRRRRWWIFGSIMAGLIGLPALTWSLKPPEEDPCAGTGEELAEIWGEGPRGRLLARVEAEGSGPSARSAEILDGAIERRAAQWIQSREDLCRDEHREDVDREQSDLQARRRTCLDYVRSSLASLVGGLEGEGDALAAHLVHATTEVERLPRCTERRTLSYWPASDPAGGLLELAGELSQAVVLEARGMHREAEAKLVRLVERTEGSQPLLHAEALYRLGHVQGAHSRAIAAFATLDRARNAAFVIGHEPLLCQALAHQAKLAANVALDARASARELAFARACVEGTDARSPMLLADLHEAEGLLALVSGDGAGALEAHERALALRLNHLGDTNAEVSKSLHNLGNAWAEAGDWDQATERLMAALTMRESLLGSEHPSIADVLHDLATVDRETGALDRAEQRLLRAAEIYRKTLGADASPLATTHLQLALIALDRHDAQPIDPTREIAAGAQQEDLLEAATMHLRRVEALHEGNTDLPADHPQRAARLQTQGRLEFSGNDTPAALRAYERATAILRARSPSGPRVLDGVLKEVSMLAVLERHDEVVRKHEVEGEPLRRWRADLPAAQRGLHAWYLGEAHRQTGDQHDAIDELRGAVAAYEELGEMRYVAELRWTLAKMLRLREPERSRRLAEAALSYYREHDSAMTQTISQWLESTGDER